MSLVNLVIDGKKVAIGKDKTLLDAAQKAGIEIPTLCYHKKLLPYGACRLCMVELIRGHKSSLVASCAYGVEEGLEVRTNSDRVMKVRKLMIELLLAQAPYLNKLHKYAQEYGVKNTRFNKKLSVCILCGLCARYCAEVKKEKSVGFIGRGVKRRLSWIPDSGYSEKCAKCFECASICPTGVFPSNCGLSSIKHLK